jgi:two-component system, NtrC family, response regulator HydG
MKAARLVGLIGADPRTEGLFEELQRFAHTRLPLLLTGETGVGKEVAAQAVHRLSPRRERPWVALNCAALPETLAESELFGHERGAFTGADRARPGAFEAADGGTLFLDEVGELPLGLQAKLLRALEVKEVRRVGADKGRTVDVRLVAATNRDLRREIARGTFREDLFYRLAVCVVRLSPLRDRPGDIAPLCRHFLDQLEAETGPRQLSPEALERLQSYPWPGNVRELRNVVYRAAVVSPGLLIASGALQLEESIPEAGGPIGRRSLRELDRDILLTTLEQSGWNRRETARVLGISRSTVKDKIRRYGLIPSGEV